jgi:LmbE family N-acetylglucosaminyl deacetylase
MLDVLVIAPHPDDAELGMGGTILKFISQGIQVGVLDLTNGEPTPYGTPEIRAKETAAASEVLGLTWRQNLGLPNRSLEPTEKVGERYTGSETTLVVCALLDRCASRPCGRHRTGRGSSFLG